MLDEVRRGAVQDASRTEKDVYEGVRRLLLRGEEKILSDREAREKLDRLFALNQPLHTAYLLKEELRSLWSCSSRAQAEPALDNRLKNACAGGVRQLKKFARAIAAHRSGILNYFDHPFTAGIVEGINNKIKPLKREE